MRRWASSAKAHALLYTLYLLLPSLLSLPAYGQCSSLESPNTQTINPEIYFDAGTSGLGAELNSAIGMWRSGCGNSMGIDFPALVNGRSSGSLTYTLQLGGHNPDNAECGRFSGLTIVIFQTSTDSTGHSQSCGNIPMNIAHEIGHVLGLNDAPLTTGCQFHIMSWINRNNAYSRSVSTEECGKVDSKWSLPNEPGGTGGPVISPRPCI